MKKTQTHTWQTVSNEHGRKCYIALEDVVPCCVKCYSRKAGAGWAQRGINREMLYGNFKYAIAIPSRQFIILHSNKYIYTYTNIVLYICI